MEKINKPTIRFTGFVDNWKEESVGTYYDFKNGLNKGKEFFGYGKPIVNFTDVFHKRGLLPNHLNGKVDVTADEIKNYSVQKGDIFFTRTSETIEEIGQPSVMLVEPYQAVFSGFVLRARAIDEDPLEIVFKQYAFFTHSFRSEMVKKSSMTTRALTSGTAIKKMLFSFPQSKTEQQKIGNFFENLDKLITQHQQKYSKLQALKKAMLGKMFPKQGQSVPEIRFKGFEGDWKPEKIGDISDSFSGGTPSVGISKYYGGSIPFIRSGEINSESTVLFITEAGLNESSAKLVKNGDILYALYGATSGVAGLSKINGAINQAVLAIIPYENKDSYFLMQWLRKQRIQIISTYIQGGQGNLSGNIVKSLEIKLPNYDEQKMIGNYFKNLDELIKNHETQITKLQNIKKAFLAKMFV